jgi:hypothetical protein
LGSRTERESFPELHADAPEAADTARRATPASTIATLVLMDEDYVSESGR